MDSNTITMKIDGSEVSILLDEAKAMLEQLADIPDALLKVRDLFSELSECFRFDTDSNFAAGTGELTVTLKPSDRFLGLMTTLRAIKRNFCVIH
ncbi:hypothetical protein [Candidatus Vondammii sp. HM_W22]|uniref:hypothetical protein n=1 Tax=Candidatus Vondammii sp. HM_W22 TaxID=2687299 RepID=UPI002E7B6E94|nr:hypothetical protein [Candidatus Vondammii sp. HM_W22]